MSEGPARFPARDWILMPVCAIATMAVLCGIWAAIARVEVPKEEVTDGPCMILADSVMPVRGRPNTVCRPVLRDLGRTEYKFNECGHRTELACAPAPAGTFRIVAIGSSMVEGAGVAVQDTFVARLPADLERATGGKYDAYSTGMVWGSPRSVWLRIDEIFPLKPDLVLWPVTVWDLDHVNLRVPAGGTQPADERRPWDLAPAGRFNDAPPVRPESGSPSSNAGGNRWAEILARIEDSRSMYLLKHLLYKSHSQYESHFDSTGEGSSGSEFGGFIQANPPQSWREHLDDFEFYFGQVAEELKVRGIPLAVVLLPHRLQTGFVSTGRWPPRDDPYGLGRRIEPIARKYGAAYFDILHNFRNVPETDRLYFPVNGHMTAEGHRLLAAMISEELTRHALPEISLSGRGP